ncbi:hypothetical protein BIV59_08500 [Bacillus sp. MUM 13]|nr:hypothetical protein BIV59_08500 [Bacillus sp. MUM 13]
MPQDAAFLVFDPMNRRLRFLGSPAPAPSLLRKRCFGPGRQKAPSMAETLFASQADQGACAF